MSEIQLPIIGIMHSPYQEKFGIPRQPNLVQVQSYIEMQAPYNDLAAFEGIEEFSHLWLVWQFHDNKNQHKKDQFRAQVRPPRLGGNKKIGVFATRSMFRPNPMGLSVVELLDIVDGDKGKCLRLRGADLLDGTPILDIKPYIPFVEAKPDAASGFASGEPERLEVCWQAGVSDNLSKSLINLIEQSIAQDPRPAYQDLPERVYVMAVDAYQVHFSVNGRQAQVLAVKADHTAPSR